MNGAYVIELTRWNIVSNLSNFTDKTIAINNSNGINSALNWAFEQGYTETKIPKGTYLIDEEKGIYIPSFMTFNLNGARLRVRDNNLESYRIVIFENVKHSRLTNGILEGDRYNHVYTVDNVGSNTHEGGTGFNVTASKFITIDNMEIYNMTGDAGNTSNKGGNMAFYLRKATCELGTYDLSTGLKKIDLNKIRWTNQLDVQAPQIRNIGHFTLAGTGYMSLGSEITATHYDVIFYKNDGTFHSSVAKVEFFSPVEVPNDAKWAKFSLYQSKIPEDFVIVAGKQQEGNSLMVWNLDFSENINIEKNNFHHCRRQGLSLSGRFIYVRENEIHHISGTLPEGGIDIEDGYDLNQHYFIEKNNFHDNRGYDLVITNGKHMKIINNKFNRVKGVSLAINEPTDRILVSGNSFNQSFVVISGEGVISDNLFYGCSIQFSGGVNGKPRHMIISDNYIHNSSVTINIEVPHLLNISGCKFHYDNDSSFPQSNFLSLNKEPQTFSNCTFIGKTGSFFAYNNLGTKAGWIFKDCNFIGVNSGLANGTYNNCNFTNTLPIIAGGGSALIFNQCNFHGNSNQTLIEINGAKSFHLTNCRIEQFDGTAVKIRNASEEIKIDGNYFVYPNGSLNIPIIRLERFFEGKMLSINNNTFSSLNTRMALELLSNNSTPVKILISNNSLVNTTYSFNNKELLINNVVDNVLDPYFTSHNEPSTGFFTKGQIVKKSSLKPGDYSGWICISEGYATSDYWKPSTIMGVGNKIQANGHVFESITSGKTARISPVFSITPGAITKDVEGFTKWTPSTNYKVGDQVVPTKDNGYFYECIKSGISGITEPKWSMVIAESVNDGSAVWTVVRPIIMWKEIGAKAEFKPYGLISN